jgi:hypothetical protein
MTSIQLGIFQFGDTAAEEVVDDFEFADAGAEGVVLLDEVVVGLWGGGGGVVGCRGRIGVMTDGDMGEVRAREGVGGGEGDGVEDVLGCDVGGLLLLLVVVVVLMVGRIDGCGGQGGRVGG